MASRLLEVACREPGRLANSTALGDHAIDDLLDLGVPWLRGIAHRKGKVVRPDDQSVEPFDRQDFRQIVQAPDVLEQSNDHGLTICSLNVLRRRLARAVPTSPPTREAPMPHRSVLDRIDSPLGILASGNVGYD